LIKGFFSKDPEIIQSETQKRVMESE